MKVFLIFCLAASFGSFLGLVLDRFPEKSIVWPASHCDSCQKSLAIRDLIPILSQIINKSSCRFCQAKIPLFYGLLELVSGLLGLAFTLNLVTFGQVWLIFMGLLLSAYDIKEQAYPSLIWLIFTMILMVIYPLNLLTVILLLLGIFALLKNIKIGSGDFLYLASLALSLSFQHILWIIQIASLLGIGYYFIHQKDGALPFVPFLFTAYLLVLFL